MATQTKCCQESPDSLGLANLLIVASQVLQTDVKHPCRMAACSRRRALTMVAWHPDLDLAFVWHRYIRNSVAMETLGY
jgi:hypothetical protein